MEITYYQTKDSANTINKTLELIGNEQVFVPFSDPPLNFSLYLSNKDIYKIANYCKVNNRYYFVNFEQMNPKIISASFSLDLLESYKSQILESDFDISEKSTIDYNTDVPISSQIKKKIIKSNVTINEDKSIIVTTVGKELSWHLTP